VIVFSSGGSTVFLIYLIVLALMVVSEWIVFTKAGQPGWAAIIPIYTAWVLLKVVGRPGWWIVLFLIPIVDIVVWIIVCIDLAKRFGHGGGFAVGLMFLPFIFMPILAFGGSTYQPA
jgi:hypothetical protein